jgi:hypothetical protein
MAYPHRAFEGYPQQYAAAVFQTRARQPHATSGSALNININPYAAYAAAPHVQQYQAMPSQSPQSSQSPFSEDANKPSLPSISNLLGIADGDRPGQDG